MALVHERYHEHMRFVLFFLTTLAIAGDFTTSLGDTYPYMISAITTDSAGNTYVVGSRALGGPSGIILVGNFGAFTGNPTATPLYGGSDVFVSKLDPNGQLLFTDTFGGKDPGPRVARSIPRTTSSSRARHLARFTVEPALQTPNPTPRVLDLL